MKDNEKYNKFVSGKMYSGSYPKTYGGNLDDKQEIRVPDGKIEIEWHDFALEIAWNGCTDWVEE